MRLRAEAWPIRRLLLLLICANAIAGAQLARRDTIVRMAGAPQHAGIATLAPEITIGGSDATANEYLFSAIHGLLAARDGSIWVVDGRRPMERQLVRQYDSTGKFLRNIGRRGEGPGEWRMPHELEQLPDGRVLLREDVAPNPIYIYRGRDGTYDSTLTFRQTIYSFHADTSGVIWVFLSVGGGMTLSAGGPLAYVRMFANGRIIDTIPARGMPSPPERKSLHVTIGERSSSSVFVPFQPSAYYAWSPAGYFVGLNTTRYAIDLLKPPINRARGRGGAPAVWREGDPVLSIRRNVAPVAVSDAERRDRRDYMVAQVRASGGTASDAIPEVERTKPPITRVLFDYDARIWVGIATPSERFVPPPPAPPRAGQRAPAAPLAWREPSIYDVYQPDGRYVGQVQLPYAAIQWVARGDHVWTIERDDDGVESIRRYRIQWAK